MIDGLCLAITPDTLHAYIIICNWIESFFSVNTHTEQSLDMTSLIFATSMPALFKGPVSNESPTQPLTYIRSILSMPTILT